MKRHFVALLVMLITANAPSASAQDSGEMAVAPGGDPTFYVMNGGAPEPFGDRIVECRDSCAQKRILVTANSASEPEQMLGHFSGLKLAVDGRTLFFESEAWATSNAVHAVDLATGRQRYVTDGSIACVIGTGRFQGALLVAKRKHFVQGGSYNPLYLFDANGKELGLAALNVDEAPKFCGSGELQ